MNHLFLNDVFLLNETRYRVIHIEPGDRLYGYPIDQPSGLPVGWKVSELAALGTQSRLKVVSAPELQRPLVASIKARQVADCRWEVVRELVEKQHLDLMERKTRAKTIAHHCELVNKSDRHLMELLRRLWRFGIEKSSLTADYHNSGRITDGTLGAVVVEIAPPTGKELVFFSPAAQRARGRRPIYTDYVPFSYPPQLKEMLIQEVREMYLKDDIVSIRAVQDRVLGEHFCKRDASGEVLRNENQTPQLLPLGKRPSNEQIRYLIKKAVPPHEAHAKRVGEAEYRNNVARSDGTVHDDSVGPGDVYEIDATILDLWLVSRYHRSVIVGKATFYLIVDRSSDLIVGFYLSLRKPSWECAKRAILSISSDWEALCKALNIKYRKSDWPAHRVYPNRFFTDRGEGISEKSDVLVDIAGIEVTTAPGASPRRKSRVEGSFSTTHVPIKDNVGGYEPPKNVKKRLGKKYYKDSRYSLDEAAAVIVRIIIKHNNSVRVKAVLHPSMVYDGFEATPINIWNHNIARSMGKASRHDFEYMKQRLLPVDSGVATQDGIEFRKLLYSFDSPRFAALCAWAARGRKTDVVVQYDPARAGEIWVSERSSPNTIYRATLTSRDKDLEGASWEEVTHFLQALAVAERKGKTVNQELRIGFTMDTEAQDRELARRTAEDARGVPLGTRVRVGKEARVYEAEAREHEHMTLQTSTTVAIQGFTPLAIDEPIVFDASDVDVSVEPLAEAHIGGSPNSAVATPSTPNETSPRAADSTTAASAGLLTNLLGLMNDTESLEH
jgi:hypothetical protein